MDDIVYYVTLFGGSWSAMAVFSRRWPGARWGPAVGMAFAAAAYVAAETPGAEKWALSVFVVNVVLAVYVVMRSVVRFWASDRDG